METIFGVDFIFIYFFHHFFFRKNRFGNHNIQITIILEFFATAFNQRYDIYISILSLPADFILLLFFPSFSFFLKKILQKFSTNSPQILQKFPPPNLPQSFSSLINRYIPPNSPLYSIYLPASPHCILIYNSLITTPALNITI